MWQRHAWNMSEGAAQKMSQCSRNVLQVTRRRCYNVSGTSGKLLQDEVTHVSGRSCNLLTSRKMLQRIRNVLQATWRRCCKIARTSFKGLEEDVTTSCMEHGGSVAQKMSQCIRNVLQVTRRGCYNVSGTSGKLLQDEVTHVSGRSCNLLTSRKMLQRIRNVLQATWRRCCKIANVPKCPLNPPQVSPSVP